MDVDTVLDKSIEEQIQSCLGKDRYPNLHWQPIIPPAWGIPSRTSKMLLCDKDLCDSNITLDGIEYNINNLGYRANFNFIVDDLKDKDILLVLGDSDASGKGVEFEDMYSTKIQQKTDLCVVNLGVPGLSPDGMTRIGVQSIMALGSAVKQVIVLWPVSSLREFVSKKFKAGVHTIGGATPYKTWWDHIDWVSNNYNYQKNHMLLEQTALNVGAEYHELIINRYDKTTPTTYKVVDEVFTEFTAESHTAIANYFIEKINKEK
jgi:hypothetical protein